MNKRIESGNALTIKKWFPSSKRAHTNLMSCLKKLKRIENRKWTCINSIINDPYQSFFISASIALSYLFSWYLQVASIKMVWSMAAGGLESRARWDEVGVWNISTKSHCLLCNNTSMVALHSQEGDYLWASPASCTYLELPPHWRASPAGKLPLCTWGTIVSSWLLWPRENPLGQLQMRQLTAHCWAIHESAMNGCDRCHRTILNSLWWSPFAQQAMRKASWLRGTTWFM